MVSQTIDDGGRSIARRNFLAGLGLTTVGVAAAGDAVLAEPAAPPASKNVVPSVCVFDVNGSLLDTDSLGPLFQRVFGDWHVVREWYEELALYSNVITSSGSYPGTFIELGQAVLRMVANYRHVEIHSTDIEELEARILSMPAYPDVRQGLERLKAAGFRLVTLTNSPPGEHGSAQQLARAGIADFFEAHFNTQSVRAYKVSSSVYHMVAETLTLPPAACCMITAHAWDALGAQFTGFAAGLMNRPGQASLVMRQLPQPEAVARDLPSLATQLTDLWRHS